MTVLISTLSISQFNTSFPCLQRIPTEIKTYEHNRYTITKTRLFKYIENFTTKTKLKVFR